MSTLGALGLTATIALAQQFNPAPGSGATPPSAADGLDPSMAARPARYLLRNGMDYLAYREYERALSFLKAIQNRQEELSEIERIQLKKGITLAQQGIREAANGPRVIATTKARPSVQPGAYALAKPAAAAETPAAEVAATADPKPNPDGVQLAGAVLSSPPQGSLNPSELPSLPAPIANPEAAPPVPTTLANQPAPLPEVPAPGDVAMPGPVLTAAPVADDRPVFGSRASRAPMMPAQAPPLPETPPAVALEQPAPAVVPAPNPASSPAVAANDPPVFGSSPAVPPTAPAPAPVPDPVLAGAPASLPAGSTEVELPALPGTPTRTSDPMTATAAAPTADPSVAPAPVPAPAPVAELPAASVTPPSPLDPTAPPAVAPSASMPGLEPVVRVADASQGASDDRGQAVPMPAAEAPPAPEAGALPPLPPSSSSNSPASPGRTSGNGYVADPNNAFNTQGMRVGNQSILSPRLREEVERIAQRQPDDDRALAQRNAAAAAADPTTPGSTPPGSTRLELPRAPSPTEARPLRRIPVPEEFVPLGPREWDPNRKYWAAAGTCHMILYFQDPVLERYGQSAEQAVGPIGRYFSYPLDDPRQSNQRNQILQPFYSIGKFAFQVGTLPYKLVVDPPWEAEYDLGYYRPGDKIPTDTIMITPTGVGPPLKGRNY
jgi:hypothetical protein